MEGTLRPMSGLSRIPSYVVLLAVTLVFTFGHSRVAAAEARGQSIHVLSIDSDDADEQADALTAALRSHVRQTSGWTLLETTQSLSMLTAAFQCPQKPDAGCLRRIGDKLKTDQLIWGVMSKAPNHQVTAEMHLWSRGKPDQVTRVTFSDNMKDSNDDALRKLAAQVFSKLLGLAGGTLVVHASADAGTIVVDGVPGGTLDHGRATLALSAGPHTIDIQAPGFANARREVLIQSSASSPLEIVLEADTSGGAAVSTGPSKPLPVRKIVGWGTIGGGAVLLVVGTVLGVNYLGDRSDLNNARTHDYGEAPQKVPGMPNLVQVAVQDPCNPAASNNATNSATVTGCNALNSAKSAEVGEITTLVLGGALVATGVFLLMTDHPAADAAPPPAKTGLSNVHFLPSIAPGGGSMVVVGQF
jgi:hypothetical protein